MVLTGANVKVSLEEIRMQQNTYSTRESPTKVDKTTYQLRGNGKEVDAWLHLTFPNIVWWSRDRRVSVRRE